VFEPQFAFLAAETPNSRQTPSIGILDFRLEKTLRLASTNTLGVYVDALNATNVGLPLAYVRSSGLQFGDTAIAPGHCAGRWLAG
jgi:hypothetical protein